MKILQLSNNLSRDVTGGTELFIEQVSQQQLCRHEVLWAAHQNNDSQPLGEDCHKGINVFTLPPIVKGNRIETVSHCCREATGFADLLAHFKPDIVHLHSLSYQCGLAHIKLAKSAGAKVVMTVHAPGFTCIQGSLLYRRKTICDGAIRDEKCTECRVINGRLPALLARLIATYRWPYISPEGNSKVRHVLTAKQLTAAFRQAWAKVVHDVDAFHVLCNWSQQVLRRNEVPESKLHLIRTAGPEPLPLKQRKPMEDGALRCVYWGRCAEVKGIHIIIDAVQKLPIHLPIKVSFYGPHWDNAYGQAMLSRIVHDPRFTVHGNLPKEKLLPKLQQYDVALIPSTWLETGPLTVLEAFAAGLSVIGSDLGGIRELLKNQEGCFLIPSEIDSWSNILAKIVSSPHYLNNQPKQYPSFKELNTALNTLYLSLN
ncbi:glycosyltransferase [Nodosilinea sp. LEGE 06152]|uniref:glycosyltransferase n=1 Tax=Nodosilinea sp. LEGE 06152 TaxID=2777966 RepID=UPI0018803F81|nr:glycosyltransferase [Nodosilinea sp. LEGE 06152]MBE9158412.1 glycosyltransferase [Nodosilinea sp. LEGE 06152]